MIPEIVPDTTSRSGGRFPTFDRTGTSGPSDDEWGESGLVGPGSRQLPASVLPVHRRTRRSRSRFARTRRAGSSGDEFGRNRGPP